MSFFTDALGGFGTGMLSLGGLGFLSDPLGELKSELNQLTTEQQQLINRSALEASTLNAETLQQMFQLQNSARVKLESTIELNNTLLWQGLKKDNFFLAAVAAVVLMVIVYLILEPKCC